jgi:succinyl-diaminopimelate desuccinylase
MSDVLELVKTLVSTPSQLGDTSAIEELVSSRLGKVRGAGVERVSTNGRGNNVVANVFHDDSLPTVLLNGHLDTVEVCRGWTMEPLEPVVDGDRLYGLGSADMKAGVAIAMMFFERLAALGTVNVTFAGTVDEEGDSAGAFTLLDSGIKADICLIPEPSAGTLMMGCRGRVVFETTIHGASAHGAKPEDGVNAISEASRLVNAIGQLPLLEHEVLGRGSVCILEMTGGTRTLSVPDSCWLKIDRHYVIGESKERMLADLRDAASSLESTAEFDISYWKERPTPFLEPYMTENQGIVNQFVQAIGGLQTYGKSVGDYNAFAKVIPTIVYGPAGGNWHSPDEWVSISSIYECLEGYEKFARALSR